MSKEPDTYSTQIDEELAEKRRLNIRLQYGKCPVCRFHKMIREMCESCSELFEVKADGKIRRKDLK